MLKWLLLTCLTAFAGINAAAQKQSVQSTTEQPGNPAAQAVALLKAGKIPEGKAAFMNLIKKAQQQNNKEQEAAWWMQLGNSLPEEDTAAAGKIASLQKALEAYESIPNIKKQIALLEKIASLYIRLDNMDKAELELNKLLQLQQSQSIREIQNTCDLLTIVYRAKGNLSQALYYAMQAIKIAEGVNDSIKLGRFYSRLSFVYKDLEQHEQCMYWQRKAFEWQLRQPAKDTFALYTATDNIVNTLILVNNPREALKTALEIMDKYPAEKPDQKHVAAMMLAKSYEALTQPQLAEKYYLEAVAWEEQNPHGFTLRFQTYYQTGRFYSEQRKYEQSRYYLTQAANTKGFVNSATQRNVQLLLFRADSAAGNYQAAIDHYQRYKAINDTMYNVAKSRQIEEMQAKYESDKKEKDIQLLRRESQLQQSQLKQASLAWTVTIAIIALLLIIIALLYNRYRIRQRSNRQLENQQKEINLKNVSLQKLVNEKDGLLEEKEWLLKEIHHRVNNNLQIVMSLLNTQSAYLDNDSAILAIRDSQHRMRAMSLIHQKLYQSDKVANIDMQAYIEELTSYLDDNFNVNNRIRFQLYLAPLELDIAQAVPLGLIINEIITNSMKYAFPGNSQGTIHISMELVELGDVLLVIADNGKGLPPGFDIAGTPSLGMSLVQGLTKQLNGTFVIKSREGVTVNIRFPQERSGYFTAVDHVEEQPV
ncbi:sensor histidine kinase [Paraflavitalea soli]|uniref:histidine kinase n=1 Tax=Paraflavitalea soli TaxID=2315862 RepID=A0A3B7MS64_9BACT|nr:sensor histidine kinase [Paraflavitalea soli]AXY77362.1 sensor histidine kinase [Paraflavitalea soli]